MKLHMRVLLAALCLPLLVACGNRSTHRSADRSQRLVGQEVATVGDEQSLTEQDVATSRQRTGARTRSVAASSYKETSARSTNAAAKAEAKAKAKAEAKAKEEAEAKAKAKQQPVAQPTEPKNRNVVQDIVQGETKTAETKVLDNQPADKPLAQQPVQEPVQQPVKQVTPTRVVAVASGSEKVLVEGCVLKQATSLSAYSVVVGSFSQPESAVSLIRKLNGMGIKPYFVQNEKGMYRLISGSFEDRDEADYQVLKLDVEAIKAWVFIR